MESGQHHTGPSNNDKKQNNISIGDCDRRGNWGSAGRRTTGPALIANWQRIEELLNSELDLCAVTRLPAGMEPAGPAHEVSIPFQSHDANMNIEAPGFMKSSDS
jgi:hypothetical protein